MLPQLFAATPVAQARDQVIAVLLEPVTRPLNSCVLLVITLAVVGEIVMETPEELLPPQPRAPSTAARVSTVENFHQLIPVLPRLLNLRPRYTSFGPCRSTDPSIFKSPILISALQAPQLKRSAHREPERTHRIEEIRLLRVIEQINDLRRDLRVPDIRQRHLGLVDVPWALIGIGGGLHAGSRYRRYRSRELRLGRGDHFRHAVEVVRPINTERRLHNGELYDQFQARRGARLEIRARLKLKRARNGRSRKLLHERRKIRGVELQLVPPERSGRARIAKDRQGHVRE